MAEGGQGRAQGFIEKDLFRRIADVIVPPDDCVDPHGDVVDDHGQIVGRGAIAALNDKIVQFGILKDNIAFDDIRNDRGSG